MKTKVMTKAQKRVAIAKDVITHLRSRFLRADRGNYLDTTPRAGKSDFYHKGSDLRDVLKSDIRRCDVCAKGAMFISHVMRFDAVKVESDSSLGLQFSDDTETCKPLLASFSKRQLDSIENAFEGRYIHREATKEEMDFGKGYRSSSARLIAIMRNIIKNKGTFKP